MPLTSMSANFVYRVDERSPSQIFRDGFTSWGNNMDLLDHVSGISCHGNSYGSAFIPTSASRNSALRIANEIFSSRLPRPQILYLYRIRADSRFYNVYSNLESIDERANIEIENNLYYMADRQEEVVALRRIPTTQIHQVTELSYNNGEVNEGTMSSNNNYVMRQTNINLGVIPGVLPTNQNTNRNAIYAFGALISACFLPRTYNKNWYSGLRYNAYTSIANILNESSELGILNNQIRDEL